MSNRKNMSVRQRFSAMKEISKHCKLVDNYAVYDDGFSDAFFVNKYGASEYQIAQIRKELVGSLKPIGRNGGNSLNMPTLKAALDRLEDRIARIEGDLYDVHDDGPEWPVPAGDSPRNGSHE